MDEVKRTSMPFGDFEEDTDADEYYEAGQDFNQIKEKQDKRNMNELLWNILREHWGHKVEIAVYGDPDNPANVCLEDMDTNEVILDAELYTLIARDDI